MSTVAIADPISPPVARFATVRPANTVDHALWSVATGVFVPIPSLLFVLSQKKLELS